MSGKSKRGSTEIDTKPAQEIDLSAIDPSEYRFRSGSFGDAALPHRHVLEGLELEIEECVTDIGEEVPMEPTTTELTLVGLDWGKVTVHASVTLEDWAYDYVFPLDDGGNADGNWKGRLGLVYWCKQTMLRGHSNDTNTVDSPGSHNFEVTIERDDVWQSIKLQPALIRIDEPNVDVDDVPETDYARYPGQRLAEGETWTIKTDHTRSTRNFLNPETKNFSEHDYLPGEDHLIFLDLDRGTPALYLNGDHERIIAALDNDSNQGWEGSIREVAYDTIEAEIWPQLLLEAASDITGDYDGPEAEWKQGVIEKFRERLYGEETSYEEAVQNLYEDVSSPERLPQLMQRLDHAIQTRNDAPTHLNKLLNLVDNR